MCDRPESKDCTDWENVPKLSMVNFAMGRHSRNQIKIIIQQNQNYKIFFKIEEEEEYLKKRKIFFFFFI